MPQNMPMSETRNPTAEEREIMQEMIDDGTALCESNTLDGHRATRIGPDGCLYCAKHDENYH